MPAPVRILYCESNTDGTVGGSHFCLLHLIEGLDRSRFSPLALFYDDHALIPRFRATCDTMVVPPPRPWVPADGALPQVRRLARRAVNLAKFVLRVRAHVRFLKQQRIALVHLNNSVTRHHDWMMAARAARIPCLTHERGVNPGYTWSDRRLARQLVEIIPVSRWIERHLITHGLEPRNITVRYDGLEPDSVRPTRPAEDVRREWNVGPEQPVIGIVGNVREWKGQEVVARALIPLVRRHPDVVCFFVGAVTPGDRPYEARIRRAIEDAGLEANVRFTGYQRHVADFLNVMSVVVHASILPEPFGMVALEGMALRKPVVAAADGGVAEIVSDGETGFTYPPGDADALAERLARLLGNPALASAMGEAGLTRLRTVFPQRQYVDGVQRRYDEILGLRRA